MTLNPEAMAPGVCVGERLCQQLAHYSLLVETLTSPGCLKGEAFGLNRILVTVGRNVLKDCLSLEILVAVQNVSTECAPAWQ